MINLLKKFSQNKILYIFTLLLLVLTPTVLNFYAEADTLAIATAIGVDMSESQYEVSISMIVPKGSGEVSSNLEMVSAKGTSINDALSLLSFKLGKKVGLAHCEVVIISEKLFNGDVLKYLDYFVRTNNLTTNSLLITTNGDAKDIVGAIVHSKDPYAENLKKIIEYNDKFLFTLNMNIENFYKTYFSKQSVAFVSVVNAVEKGKEGESSGQQSQQGEEGGAAMGSSAGDINLSSANAQTPNSSESVEIEGASSESEDDSSSSSSQQDSQGSSSGQSSEEKVKNLNNEGKVAVIKNGIKIRELTKEESFVFSLLDSEVRTVIFSVENIDIREFKNAKIVFEVFEKTTKKQWFFNNGIPVVKFTVNLDVKVDEIIADFYTEMGLNEISTFFNDTVRQQMTNKVRQDFAIAVENSKSYQTDNFNVYDLFNKLYNNQWKKYLNTLEDENDYLYGVIFELDVVLENKL